MKKICFELMNPTERKKTILTITCFILYEMYFILMMIPFLNWFIICFLDSNLRGMRESIVILFLFLLIEIKAIPYFVRK